jgi:predicted ATPase
VSRLPLRRFITIVGPGGVGKTTVALAVAHAFRASYPDGIRFLDLAPIADPALVPSALVSALGQPVRSGGPIPALVAVLRPKKTLLVLDSCERVVQVAATPAEAICKGAPDVHVLATSREALRGHGEHIQRLPPLETPAASIELTATQELAFPAVQLFVGRAAAALDSFARSDANAPMIVEICRRLDGIALAIELAAGRVDTFGVLGVAARLDDRFRLLTQGHRTAKLHHQTLDVTFDWSFQVLADPTRAVLSEKSVGVWPS